MYSAFAYGACSGPNSRRSSAGTGSRRESLFLNPQDSLDSNPPGFINASSLAASAALPPGSGNNGTSGTGSQSLFSSIGTGVVSTVVIFPPFSIPAGSGNLYLNSRGKAGKMREIFIP